MQLAGKEGGIKKYGCYYAKICHKMITKLGRALTQTCDMPRLMINLTLTRLYVSYCYRMKSNTIHFNKTDAKKEICFTTFFFLKGKPNKMMQDTGKQTDTMAPSFHLTACQLWTKNTDHFQLQMSIDIWTKVQQAE